ncbi:transglycosylase SLT domain-containing protein [Massilia sp. YIM B02769]|uniref:lytic transglycosylase domain-containing protein n=1 Tax=Massilia sp. YIM B02769 TaxID=3050129 RepID=UPI00280602B7|nr:transglycosylase SLT domain-containing protein [Massilia sp. YIM B02769]
MLPRKLIAGAVFAATSVAATHVAAMADAPPAASSPAPGAATVPAAPATALATTSAVALAAAPASEASRADDDTFLLLREAARQNDAARTNALASRLPNYVLPGYVEYYRLKPRLREATQDEIRSVLNRYEGSAVADRLRTDWLLELGRQREWNTFEREMALLVRSDDLQVRCYALLARALRGERVATEARALLVNPPSYGEGCAALMTQLSQLNQLSQADLLAQLRLAGEMAATGPSRRIAALLGASDTRAAQAVDVPAVAMARGIGANRVEHEIYLVALGRMARTSLKLATVALEKNSSKFTPEERAIGWANVALAASITLSNDAHDYWKRAEGAPLTNFQLEWKTRMALRRGDWATVAATIDAMPPTLAAESGWIYWRGRAHEAQGRREDAQALFRRIATPNNFYGQLATEELGELVNTPPLAAAPTPGEVAYVAALPAVRQALKFYELSLRADGNREWNWALRNLSERQLLAAAEYARRNELLDRMVETSLRTRNELDFNQRFPAPHNDILQPTAKGLSLDTAWVYGLIRQESRFVSDARSGVGAAGLMQVMPATGKWVAAKIGLTDFVHDMLHDARTNITLGTNYMNMVLENNGGSQVLATAAYNAGPGRSRTWRGVLDAPMEGAIFVESIPFTETRTYVRNVMSNATNYAALFDKRPQSLKARLGTITPRGSTGALP